MATHSLVNTGHGIGGSLRFRDEPATARPFRCTHCAPLGLTNILQIEPSSMRIPLLANPTSTLT